MLLPLATLLICKMFKVGQTDLGDTKVIREELKALEKMSKGEKISTVYLLVAILGFALNDQVAKLLPFISNEGFAIVLLVASFVIPVNWKKGEFLMDSKTALEKTSWSTFILLGGALTLGGIFKTPVSPPGLQKAWVSWLPGRQFWSSSSSASSWRSSQRLYPTSSSWQRSCPQYRAWQ